MSAKVPDCPSVNVLANCEDCKKLTKFDAKKNRGKKEKRMNWRRNTGH